MRRRASTEAVPVLEACGKPTPGIWQQYQPVVPAKLAACRAEGARILPLVAILGWAASVLDGLLAGFPLTGRCDGGSVSRPMTVRNCWMTFRFPMPFPVKTPFHLSDYLSYL